MSYRLVSEHPTFLRLLAAVVERVNAAVIDGSIPAQAASAMMKRWAKHYGLRGKYLPHESKKRRGGVGTT